MENKKTSVETLLKSYIQPIDNSKNKTMHLLGTKLAGVISQLEPPQKVSAWESIAYKFRKEKNADNSVTPAYKNLILGASQKLSPEDEILMLQSLSGVNNPNNKVKRINKELEYFKNQQTTLGNYTQLGVYVAKELKGLSSELQKNIWQEVYSLADTQEKKEALQAGSRSVQPEDSPEFFNLIKIFKEKDLNKEEKLKEIKTLGEKVSQKILELDVSEQLAAWFKVGDQLQDFKPNNKPDMFFKAFASGANLDNMDNIQRGHMMDGLLDDNPKVSKQAVLSNISKLRQAPAINNTKNTI